MRALTVIVSTACAGMLAAGAATAGSHAAVYSAKDLLSPCQEADNDARWGDTAETECEQYLLGYIGALAVVGNTEVCPPADNTADELRWAFMRWVHESYSERTLMAAPDAVMALLKEDFACN